MNFARHALTQRFIHSLLALYTAHAGEFITDDYRLKVLTVAYHLEVGSAHASSDILLYAFWSNHFDFLLL